VAPSLTATVVLDRILKGEYTFWKFRFVVFIAVPSLSPPVPKRSLPGLSRTWAEVVTAKSISIKPNTSDFMIEVFVSFIIV
jgi:hypothetical protein